MRTKLPLILSTGIMVAAFPSARASLVAYWDFNDGVGSPTAADASGNGRNATLQNMDPATDWVAGRTGGAGDFALDFDNVDDFVEADTYRGQTGRSERTVSAWINSNGTNDGIVYFGTNTAGQKFTFRTNSNNGNADTLRVEVNGGYQVGSTDIVGEGWTHVAVTWEDDGTPDVQDAKLYVNGVLEPNSASLDEVMNTAASALVRIGLNESNSYFSGQIDDVAIFNNALSDTQIAALAAGTSPKDLGAGAPKPALEYDASTDPNTTNATWENTGRAGNDFSLNNNAGGARHQQVVAENLGLLRNAYSFGAGDSSTSPTFEAFAGNPTNGDSASFEIVARPSDLAGREVLLDTGGNGFGTSLTIDGSTLLFTSGSNTATTVGSVTYPTLDGEFFHAVGVIDIGSTGAELSLYFDGQLADSIFLPGFTDWAGGDASGIGIQNATLGGDFGGFLTSGGAFGAFEGDIALVRFYDTALTAADVTDLYGRLVPEPSRALLLALGLVGFALRRRR
ncbi:MAG: LamG domain-containing protein [Verrucomicrobiales bacterium]